ncbi:MAG: ribosome silencing factor [Pseudomonadota bacterium]
MKKTAKKLTIEHSRNKALRFLRAALSKKATRPILLRLNQLTAIADYFLIVSGRSARHVTSIAEGIVADARTDDTQLYSVEGLIQGNWVLLDFGEVVIHIFQDSAREFYDLEGLWRDAPKEQLPLEILKEIESVKDSFTDDDSFDF